MPVFNLRSVLSKIHVQVDFRSLYRRCLERSLLPQQVQRILVPYTVRQGNALLGRLSF